MVNSLFTFCCHSIAFSQIKVKIVGFAFTGLTYLRITKKEECRGGKNILDAFVFSIEFVRSIVKQSFNEHISIVSEQTQQMNIVSNYTFDMYWRQIHTTNMSIASTNNYVLFLINFFFQPMILKILL